MAPTVAPELQLPPTPAVPSPSAVVVADPMAEHLLRACGPDCEIQARLAVPKGLRLLLLRGQEFTSQLVLLRGQQVLDTYLYDGFGGELRTDRTRNILLLEQGNTAQSVQPLRIRWDRLYELKGFHPQGRMFGDNGTHFVDRDGILDIVMHEHVTLPDGLATATITWRWNGRTYRKGRCRDEATGRPGGAGCEGLMDP